MASRKCIILLTVLLLAINFCYGSENSAPDKLTLQEKSQEKHITVEELINAWVAMWNSYDLSLVDRLFLNDPNVSYLSSEKEGLIKGIDAVREHHRGFGFVEGGKIPENKLWSENLHTTKYGTTAIVTGIWYFRRGSEGSNNIQRGPVTFVCIQKDGGYCFIHLHFANY